MHAAPAAAAAPPEPPCTMLAFTVNGTPRPHEWHVGGKRGHAGSGALQKKAIWAYAIEREAKRALKLAGLTRHTPGDPVVLKLCARFRTGYPDRWGTLHTATPDADNVTKLAMDALVRAGALADDKLVADLRVQKVWHQHPGLDVTIDYAPSRDAFGLRAIAREQSPYWLSRA